MVRNAVKGPSKEAMASDFSIAGLWLALLGSQTESVLELCKASSCVAEATPLFHLLLAGVWMSVGGSAKTRLRASSSYPIQKCGICTGARTDLSHHKPPTRRESH